MPRESFSGGGETALAPQMFPLDENAAIVAKHVISLYSRELENEKNGLQRLAIICNDVGLASEPLLMKSITRSAHFWRLPVKKPIEDFVEGYAVMYKVLATRAAFAGRSLPPCNQAVADVYFGQLLRERSGASPEEYMMGRARYADSDNLCCVVDIIADDSKDGEADRRLGAWSAYDFIRDQVKAADFAVVFAGRLPD